MKKDDASNGSGNTGLKLCKTSDFFCLSLYSALTSEERKGNWILKMAWPASVQFYTEFSKPPLSSNSTFITADAKFALMAD